MAKMFRIKNLLKYQHYGNREPIWVKIYVKLLSDCNFIKLSDNGKLTFVLLIPALSCNSNAILWDVKQLRLLLHMNKPPALQELLEMGFIEEFEAPVRGECESKKLQTEKKDATFLTIKSKVVLSFLNKVSNKEFRETEHNLAPIMARLKDGYSQEQCERVIKNRCQKWAGDEKMDEYIRPFTLFRPRNFETYLLARDPDNNLNRSRTEPDKEVLRRFVSKGETDDTTGICEGVIDLPKLHRPKIEG